MAPITHSKMTWGQDIDMMEAEGNVVAAKERMMRMLDEMEGLRWENEILKGETLCRREWCS